MKLIEGCDVHQYSQPTGLATVVKWKRPGYCVQVMSVPVAETSRWLVELSSTGFGNERMRGAATLGRVGEKEDEIFGKCDV